MRKNKEEDEEGVTPGKNELLKKRNGGGTKDCHQEDQETPTIPSNLVKIPVAIK